MNVTTPDILATEQAAEHLQVSRGTIYRYIREGRLSASRAGLGYCIRKESLDSPLESTTTRPDI